MKYSTFLKKVILRCIGLCFNYHRLYLLSRLDQPLIQRIPAGLSSTVACLDITQSEYIICAYIYRSWPSGPRERILFTERFNQSVRMTAIFHKFSKPSHAVFRKKTNVFELVKRKNNF